MHNGVNWLCKYFVRIKMIKAHWMHLKTIKELIKLFKKKQQQNFPIVIEFQIISITSY